MNIERYLHEQHVWFEALEHEPTFTARGLAQTVHDEAVAKSVLVRTDEGFALIVIPAADAVDLELAKEVLCAGEVCLASEAECGHEFVDCEFGARLPFGSKYSLPTIMDRALTEFPEIVFEGNTHRQAIRMKLDDYVRIERPRIATVTQSYQLH